MKRTEAIGSTEGSTMELEIYKETRNDIDILIVAQLDNGELRLRGHDIGSAVKDFWGSDNDYEYCLSLDKENTQKLFKTLGITEKTNRSKLELIKDEFDGDKAISNLSEYCKKNGIKTSFHSYL